MSTTQRAAGIRRLSAELPDLPEGAGKDGAAGRILAVALKLFAENGFHGASIRDIAQDAGLQPATIYAHYESKERLLAELVFIGHDEHHRRLRTASLSSGSDPRDQLRAVVHAHVRLHTDFPMLATVANTELHVLSGELAAPALTLRQQSEDLMFEVIERGMAQGVFDPPDKWMTMAAIGGMGIRVAVWFTPDAGYAPDDVAATYAELALRMVGGIR